MYFSIYFNSHKHMFKPKVFHVCVTVHYDFYRFDSIIKKNDMKYVDFFSCNSLMNLNMMIRNV